MEKISEKLKKREEEMEKERQEKEKRDKEMEKKDEEIEKGRKLKNGTFYTTFDKVWKTTGCNFERDDFVSLIREKPPSFLSSDARTKPNSFAATIVAARNQNLDVKDDGQSARTSHQNSKDKIWPHNIFQIPILPPKEDYRTPPDREQVKTDVTTSHGPRNEVDIERDEDFKAPDADMPQEKEQSESDTQEFNPDTSYTPLGEIAHLVPASPLHASLYFDVAKWVFGEEFSREQVSAKTIQKLIHGAAEMIQKKTDRRVKHTGLKHMACNKMRVACQATHYDRNPCLLVIPILTVL